MADLYVNPAVHRPSEERVKAASKHLGLDLCPETLSQYTKWIHDICESYDRVYRMVETKPTVKYPRTPGYRPPPEENMDNAWYMKTNIPGAPSGPLANLRVAIKDNVCVSGVPMMNGSKLVEGLVPAIDATVVARILDAGGVIAGKAACCSLCWSGVSFMNDMAPVLHPLDPTRTTGGSSSGCAALVARGEVAMAIGSDQGGSIRAPSAFCGIVGLKPTYGLVPYTGGLSKDPTLDHLGPMARTAKECALLLEVIAGADGMDGRQPMHYTPPEYTKLLKTDVSGLRVAVLSEGFDDCQPSVVKVVQHALSLLSEAGAQVDSVSVPMHKLGIDVWKIIDTEGTYENVFNRGGGGPLRKGFRSTAVMNHVHSACVLYPNALTPPLKVAFLHAQIMKEDTNLMFYARASNLRMSLTAAYDVIFKDYDVIAMPTVRTTAPLLPTSVIGRPENTRDLLKAALANLENTCQFDVTGHPAISVNAGSDDNGLPVGMMFVGAMFHDADVLSAAHAFETLRDKMAEQ